MSLNSIAIKWIKKYQQNKAIIGSGRCKHYPSCSNYAIGCFEKFNFFKALFLTCFRILRCNPFTRKVYDPVPLNKKEKENLKKIKEQVKNYEQYLLREYLKYPLMETKDFITYIYETTFEPSILNENHLDYTNLNSEEITDNLIKVFNTDYIYDVTNITMTSLDIQVFNEKLYLFKQLVKKKKINLNYKLVYQEISTYLNEGIKYLGHSDIYIKHYECNYIIIKKEYN